MKPDSQRIAIAEACGWTAPTSEDPFIFPDEPNSGMNFYFYWKDESGRLAPLHDYLNDLNAMHEAEKMLTQAQDYHYRASILPAVCNDGSGMIAMTALAAQRAEALLRTIGKWEGVK